MADILIRGFDLGNTKSGCPFRADTFGGDTWCVAGGDCLAPFDERGADCPVTILQEGHGRLIDADAFKAMCLSATKEAKPDFIRHEDWLKSCAITVSFCRDIDEQPTIVPAEGGNADGNP